MEHRGLRLRTLVLAGLLTVLVLPVASWWAVGGTWLRVETPSLGTAAPVGSLLWVRPVSFDALTPGDLVTVQPPGAAGDRTWTHEVDAVDDGVLTTRSPLAGPDPWQLGPDDVVGRVARAWPVAGHVVAGLPILLGALLLAWALGRMARPSWRGPVLLLGAATGLCTVVLVQHPLTGAHTVSLTPAESGTGAVARVVNTGVLALRIAPGDDGAGARVSAGEVATVRLPEPEESGRYLVRVSPDLPGWTWPVVGGVWALPPLSISGRRLLVSRCVSSRPHGRRARRPR